MDIMRNLLSSQEIKTNEKVRCSLQAPCYRFCRNWSKRAQGFYILGNLRKIRLLPTPRSARSRAASESASPTQWKLLDIVALLPILISLQVISIYLILKTQSLVQFIMTVSTSSAHISEPDSSSAGLASTVLIFLSQEKGDPGELCSELLFSVAFDFSEARGTQNLSLNKSRFNNTPWKSSSIFETLEKEHRYSSSSLLRSRIKSLLSFIFRFSAANSSSRTLPSVLQWAELHDL